MHESTKPAGRRQYTTKVAALDGLPAAEREALEPVGDRYAFRVNDYYAALIDWADPADPIRQLVVPRTEELDDYGALDASDEAAVTVAHGAQHKYQDTALLLCNEVCSAYCRYCFRKRLFMNDNDEATTDIAAGLDYIGEHPEITNVLLTGGDPLLMSTRRLDSIFTRLRAIPHVRIIRIGSKLPAFDPYRILNDSELRAAFRKHSGGDRRIYLMAHFDHPRELTPAAEAGIEAALDAGVICINQCPLIRGVNDDSRVLADLYSRLSYVGCPPYYLFQGRPTAGNAPYEVPVRRGWEIFRDALSAGSGLARRARYVMSHSTGKVEILAVTEGLAYLRYHQARDPQDLGRVFVRQCSNTAGWLDEMPEPETAGTTPAER